MRRLIIICEILVVLVIIIKIVTAGGMLQKITPEAAIFDPDHAIANVGEKAPEAAPMREATDDAMARERKLAASLTDREKQLDSRESAIKEEEKKLQALKSEIIAKIDSLKGLEDKLSGMLDAVKAVEDKRLKDLATVFEATTPTQAGAMLEKMDKKLAAGIIMNMKSKKAGAIWGHIEPNRAAEIAKEITSAPKAAAPAN